MIGEHNKKKIVLPKQNLKQVQQPPLTDKTEGIIKQGKVFNFNIKNLRPTSKVDHFNRDNQHSDQGYKSLI